MHEPSSCSKLQHGTWLAKPTDHFISVSSGPWAFLLKLGSFFLSKTWQT